MSITRTTRSLSSEAARAARRWYIADAEGKVLGRLASRVALVLRGKTNPGFSPHLDAGDFVVVVNAAKIRLTGEKLEKKEYIRHTTYPGGGRGGGGPRARARPPPPRGAGGGGLRGNGNDCTTPPTRRTMSVSSLNK